MFSSSKLFTGYSTCFRQWRATDTMCSKLHGYGVEVEVYFEGGLDEKNWVWDFGGMKRATGTIDGMRPDEWLSWLLDHTVIISEDDPHLGKFKIMEDLKLIQLRTLPHTGAERFAEYLFQKLNTFVQEETEGRVVVKAVVFKENSRNEATYYEN